MRYKAIIFDMDGTIIETEHIWYHARNRLITSRNITITAQMEQELNTRCAGRSLHECCAIIKEVAGLTEPIEQLAQEERLHALSLYEEGVEFIADFLSFHTKATSLNLKLGIATNADHQTVNSVNKRLNLDNLFGKHVYHINHVNMVGKPNPAIYLHAAEQLEVDAKDCIAIEDSASGIQAAKNAGMFCIGINTAQRPHLLGDAHMVINGYQEIDLHNLLYSKTTVL